MSEWTTLVLPKVPTCQLVATVVGASRIALVVSLVVELPNETKIIATGRDRANRRNSLYLQYTCAANLILVSEVRLPGAS